MTFIFLSLTLKLGYVLDGHRSAGEDIVDVGAVTLKRSDFMTLGLNMEVEATVSTKHVLSEICGEIS